MSRNNLGSKFDDFLDDHGLLEDASAVATKRVIAYQLATAMEAKGLTKSEMARRMSTSRASLERLLDPTNSSVTLQTLQSAACALGGKLQVKLDFGRRAA